jgi:SAM-dependent methyltransferase
MSEKVQLSRDDSQELYANRQLKEIAARWDAKASTWDQALSEASCHLNEDEGYQQFLREASGIVSERKTFCSKQGLIDAGCGTGLVLCELAHSFAWALGVDISPQMIAAAERKRIAKASLVIGDCFQLPQICPRAGGIVSRGILVSHYGTEAAEMLLQSARKTLVGGGFALFDFLNKEAKAKAKHAPENKTYFFASELETIARKAGFAHLRILGEQTRRVRLLLAEL